MKVIENDFVKKLDSLLHCHIIMALPVHAAKSVFAFEGIYVT